MSTLYFDNTTTLAEAVAKIKQAPATELELKFAAENVFWQNYFNQQLLLQIAQDWSKQLKIVPLAPVKPQTADDLSEETPPDRSLPAPSLLPRRQRIRPALLILLGLSFLGLLFLTLSLAFAYFYLPKAEIVLGVEEKILEQSAVVAVDPTQEESDAEQGILPAQSLQVSLQDSAVFAATGEKEVGEKAHGEVTLRNWTNEEILLPKDTILTTQADPPLTFLLNNQTQLPPQQITGEAEDARTYTAGKAAAVVTAEQIGPEYNLAADMGFNLTGFSPENVSAVNEQPFSGGSRQTVNVVSEDDLTRARQQLKAKLSAQAKKELTQKLTPEQALLTESLQEKILAENADQAVGDEVKQFELELKLQASALAYSQSALENLLNTQLTQSIPEGFSLSGEEKTIAIQSVEESPVGTFQLNLDYKVLVVPEIDLGQLKQQLKGKKPLQAQEILKNLPNLQGYELNLWPRFPSALQTLPYQPERIDVQIETR